MANALTQKGQVTIPKTWRDQFGLKPGDKIVFAANDRGELVLSSATQHDIIDRLTQARDLVSPEFLEDFKTFGGDGLAYVKWLRGE